MSLDQFLENPYGHSTNNQQKPVIAQAEVWPAWEVSINGERLYFDYKSDGNGENERKAEVLANNTAANVGYVNLGILTLIRAKDAILSNFSEDWYSFVRSFHSKEKYTKYFNSEKGYQRLQESECFDDILAFVENGGPFPYDIVIEHLRKSPDVFENKRWCRLIQKNEGVMEAKGIRNKSGYPYQFFAVEKVYGNRKEALDDLDEQDITSSQSIVNASIGGALSEIGTKNYESVENFLAYIAKKGGPDLVHNQIKNAIEGINLKGDKIKTMTEKEANSYVAAEYGVSPADLKLLEIDIPF